MSTRRTFLRQTAAISAGLGFLPLSQACQSAMKDSRFVSNIGLQLYTVREALAEAPADTLQKIAQMGYHQVETMTVQSLGEMVPMIQDAGLKVNSSFMQWSVLTGRWDLLGMSSPGYAMEELIDSAARYELEYVVFGYLMPEERGTLDDYKAIIDQLNEAGEQFAELGVQLCYHNHNFEFMEMEGTTPFDVMIERFDPEMVKFEFDVFWASLAGWDPLATMERLGGRMAQVHLKDKRKGEPVVFANEEAKPEAFKELGQGEVDIRKVIQLAESYNVAHCHVEQDHSPNPLNSIETSLSYLRS
ncbi:MAG: TIM barrel protein [Bacteroidota bacterium]